MRPPCPVGPTSRHRNPRKAGSVGRLMTRWVGVGAAWPPWPSTASRLLASGEPASSRPARNNSRPLRRVVWRMGFFLQDAGANVREYYRKSGTTSGFVVDRLLTVERQPTTREVLRAGYRTFYSLGDLRDRQPGSIDRHVRAGVERLALGDELAQRVARARVLIDRTSIPLPDDALPVVVGPRLEPDGRRVPKEERVGLG